MALCPSCHTEQSRRVNGRCPNCKTKIEVYDGYWYPGGTGSPNLSLVKQFEQLVSDRQSAQQGRPVVFKFPTKGASFQRELVSAGRLLEMAEHDLSLASDSLKLLFTDKQFSWKNYATLRWVSNEFLIALGLVRASREAQQKKRSSEDDYIRRLLDEEDIFS